MAEAMFKTTVLHLPYLIYMYFLIYIILVVPSCAWEKHVRILIIHMKKLLDSDWLRGVQFKCNKLMVQTV